MASTEGEAVRRLSDKIDAIEDYCQDILTSVSADERFTADAGRRGMAEDLLDLISGVRLASYWPTGDDARWEESDDT